MTTLSDHRTSHEPGPVGRLVRSFPRQFWLLTAGFMFLMVGIDMCFPFETTYLTTRLGASMSVVGLLLGIPLIAVLPLYALDGAIADHYGRKPAIVTGIAVVAGLYLSFALSSSLWPIGLMVSIEAAFGWALFLTGSNAMVADLVTPARRAEAYSITRVALDLGMTAGPLLAGVVIAADPTYRTLFLTGAALCAGFVVIVLTSFRETRPAVARQHGLNLLHTLRGYAVVLRDRRFIAFCTIALLPLYGFGQIWVVLPIALREQHGVSPRQWGYLLAFYALVGAVSQYPVVRWLRGRDRLLAMAASSAFVGVGLAGAVLVPFGALTYVFVFVLSQGIVLLIPISSAVAAELAPTALRGRYMGAWTLVQMGGYGLGPAFGGIALDRLGAQQAFGLIGCCGLLGALLFAVASRRFGMKAAPGVTEPSEPMAPAPGDL